MTPKPLPKSIYSEAIRLGVVEIELAFSGGSDEGVLDVRLWTSSDVDPERRSASDQFLSGPGRDLQREVEEWGGDTFYCASPVEGMPTRVLAFGEFGETIVYDLERQVVSVRGWWRDAGAEGEDVSEPTPFDVEEKSRGIRRRF